MSSKVEKYYDVNVNVLELGNHCGDQPNASYDEKPLHQPCTHLPSKHLRQYCRNTLRNYVTIIAAIMAYGLCVTGSVVPGLTTSFPFPGYQRWLHGLVSKCPCTGDEDTFAINLAFGNMTFKQVKALDALANLLTGRGTQLFCAWLSYHVFSMGILRVLQDSSVPLDFLSAVAFDTTSVKTVWHHARTVPCLRTARSKIIVTWLGLSVIWLTVMPTLLDLTTGYIAIQNVMIDTSGNSSAPVLVPVTQSEQHDVGFDWDHLYADYCKDSHGVRDYCGHDPTHNATIAGHVFKIESLIDSQGNWITNDEIHPHAPVFCIPGHQYSWGISSGYCWFLSTIMGWWLVGMCAIWFDTMRFGHLWHTGRGFGRYRNIIDIAHHLERHLGPDLCAYSHVELNREIGQLGLVGMEVVSDGQNGHIRLSDTPTGLHMLNTPGLKFGSIERLKRDEWGLSDRHNSALEFHAM